MGWALPYGAARPVLRVAREEAEAEEVLTVEVWRGMNGLDVAKTAKVIGEQPQDEGLVDLNRTTTISKMGWWTDRKGTAMIYAFTDPIGKSSEDVGGYDVLLRGETDVGSSELEGKNLTHVLRDDPDREVQMLQAAYALSEGSTKDRKVKLKELLPDEVPRAASSFIAMAWNMALEEYPELVPGIGFHLEGDGHWDVQEIPDWVLDVAKFSGYLTIQGYASSVFETPEGEQWAQKSSGTPAPKGDEAAKEILSSFHGMALRVSSMEVSRMQLDPSLFQSAQSMAEEMEAAEESLHKAVQHGRRLSVEPAFEWVVSHLEGLLRDFREFRKGAVQSVDYLTSDGEE